MEAVRRWVVLRSVVPFIACVEVFLGENFDGADELEEWEAIEF